MRAGMTADCTDLDIGDVTDPKTKTSTRTCCLQIRPAFGGNIIATIVNHDQLAADGHRPRRRDGHAGAGPGPHAARSSRRRSSSTTSTLAVKLIERHLEPRKVNLKGARVIVAGGGGVGSKDNFKLIHDLAGRARRGRRRQPRRRRQRLHRQGAPGRARPARPSGPPCTSPWASAARCSTAPAWKNRPRSSPSTGTATPRSSAWPITASSATYKQVHPDDDQGHQGAGVGTVGRGFQVIVVGSEETQPLCGFA